MDGRSKPRRFLVCAAGIAATAALASACGGGSSGEAANAAADPPQLVTYRSAGITFRHPASWTAYPFSWVGEPHFQPLVYLSTQPLHDPCSTRGNTTTCGFPVQRLRPGGVLVVWEVKGFPGFSLRTQPGTATRIGGRPAKRLVSRRGACRSIGADQTTEIAIASPLRDNWTEVTACLRGPFLAQSERRVDALLASTRFAAH